MTFAFALTIAAALALTTTSCSNEDILTENNGQPQVTTNGVQVTVDAGFDEASTRSAVADDGTKRTLKFTTGDRLYVYGEIDASTSVAGYLTMVGSPTNDDKSAKFTGIVKAYDISGATPVETAMPAGEDPLALCTHKTTKATLIHKDLNTNAISITLGANVELYTSYMSAADVATLMTTGLPVQGDYTSGTKSFSLSSTSPIINCTLSGFEANSSHEVGLYYEAPTVWIQSFRYTFTADANGVINVAFVSSHAGNNNWKLIIGFPSDNYDIPLGTHDLTAKVYNVNRKFVNLANINADYTAQNNDVLMGTLGGNHKISIANNATVILNGANINGSGSLTTALCAGITCLGNAKIILADEKTNHAKGLGGASASDNYPGIFVPAGSTLTITGKGTLNASCNSGAYAAGIGGYLNTSCGNIVIEDGIINATGGSSSAGIGGSAGFSESTAVACGDITISGGTINATGGSYAPGIGSGCGNSMAATCGNITITTGVTSVTATKGSSAPYSIGKGAYATCGTIKIGGTTYNNEDNYLKTSPFTYQP